MRSPVVLDFGSKIAEDVPVRGAEDEAVIAAYPGGKHANSNPRPSPHAAKLKGLQIAYGGIHVPSRGIDPRTPPARLCA